MRTVIDVGANTGQFATMVHEICPDATSFSSAPLPDCFRALEATCQRIRAGLQCRTLRVAVNGGNHRSVFSPSSSLPQMASRHAAIWPQTADDDPIEAQVLGLDNAVTVTDLEPEVLVKIDVRGFEQQVIDGCERTLRAANVVVVEVAYETLYHGQAKFDGLYSTLRLLGVECRGNSELFRDERTGRIAFADALFEKAEATHE